MAELNLKQITDKLNSEFASDVRKLVFWYDANAEFQEDIDSIELKMQRSYTLSKITNFTSNIFGVRGHNNKLPCLCSFCKTVYKGQSSCRHNKIF